MKIAIVQMRVKANQVESNVKTILETIEDVKNEADLIVFPEMCVGGYLIGDRFRNKDFLLDLHRYNDVIREASKGTAVVWGNIDLKADKVYNSAFFAIDGKWAERKSGLNPGVYYKHLLPTYGFFDDHRYFEEGEGLFEPFCFKGESISIQVCEDLWDTNCSLSPTLEMKQYNPSLIINISASPWVKGKEAQRLDQILRHKLDIPFIYVNTVGMQNSGKNVVMFDGGSYVVRGDKVLKLSDDFISSVEIVDVDNFESRNFDNHKKVKQALVKALQYFDEETLPFGPKWIIGVSGGLDSSVSVSLLVEAFGKERVIGVTMPSKFTGSTTKGNAYHLANKLGFKFMEIPIGEMVDATINSLPYDEVKGLSYENIQARLRGHTLMSISSLENGVVINNGNKIEVALGYATLYGDAIGALAILGDLNKMEVGGIAKLINENEEIVPKNLIPEEKDTHVDWGFAPSAELAEGQFDPMKWGYHDLLIPYLQKYSLESLLETYIDGSIFNSKMGSYLNHYGLNDPSRFIDDLMWVLKTMNNATYKRIQMPPIVSVTNEAYGMPYRESQLPLSLTQKQKQLIDRIKTL